MVGAGRGRLLGAGRDVVEQRALVVGVQRVERLAGNLGWWWEEGMIDIMVGADMDVGRGGW